MPTAVENPAPAADRRKRDPEATRTAILDAAARLFIEKGVAAVTTNEIAKAAGVTKSLIHHHFGSKEELWTEVKRRGFEEYYQTQQEILVAAPTDTGELLRASLVAYFRFLQKHPEAVRFMSWRFVEEDDLCLAQETGLFEAGIERIRSAQEAGILRADLDPIFVIKAFLGMAMNWFQSKPLLCQMLGKDLDSPELDETYLDNVQKILLEGVLPR